jgi:serine/threonine protein kinase
MGADPAAEEPFGPYLVYERLGVGGMATVHRALERGMEGFERIVALKRLLPHLAADASFIKAFVREAKLASLLSHNNIVNIFELGRVGTQYFISMEYIDGRDIRRILRHARKVSGPPPIHVTVGILLQLCDALDHAHSKTDDEGRPLGLIHRDVSPSNVLVTSAGQVKVIDFGIARAQSSQLRTQTGRVKGKLAYMAPEALAGKDLDARSDLFAAGVIAHELLTARPLFASKNEYQTLMKVQRAEVMPPSTFNQHCPPELDAIVMRALAKEPDDRFADAGELRDELHAMRRQYGLATAERDIATWIDWAFRLEVPAGATGNTFDPPRAAEGSQRRSRARIKREDDDAAVELAWGASDDGDGGEPVVLEDVPDVSEKHLMSAGALGADVRLDLDDLADDIPTPEPSHGRDSEPDNRATVLMMPRSPRARQPSQLIPVQVPQVARPASARPAPAGPASAAIGAGVRSVMIPPRIKTVTIPPRVLPAASVAPRSGEAIAPPASVPASSMPLPTVGRAAPQAGRDALATERTPAFALDELGLAGDTIPAMPAMQSSEPIVRFREPTVPPPIVADPIIPSLVAAAAGRPAGPPERPTIPSSQLTGDELLLMPSDPETEPMLSPPAGTLADELHNPLRQLKNARAKLITPATALFAEPEPDTEVPPARSSFSLRRSSRPALPGEPPRRRWKLAVALVAVAAAGTGAAYYLTRQVTAPSGAPPRTALAPATTSALGTIELVTDPADAAITISGLPPHAGSPWVAQLAKGVHQVEIQKPGYKAWLTSIEVAAGERQGLRVQLEPLGSAPVDATLVVRSTPAGLEVVLDGKVVGKTPASLQVKPGMHTVVLRRGGVDVWKKGIDAGAGTTYELPAVFATGDAAKPEPPAGASDAAVSVAPGAVTKLAGAEPETGQLEPGTSAKLCIDPTGAVSSVELLAPVAPAVAEPVVAALRQWRYEPYKLDGAAHAACFAVSLGAAK